MDIKEQLISALEEARAKFMASIDGLTEDDMYSPGAVGIWSVKDVLAHLTAWESELVTALVRIENGQKSEPNIVKIDDIDDWNDERYRENAARDLDVIWEDFMGVGKHLIEAVQALDERTLADNRGLPWMEGEPLAYLVYENAIWHEEEHAEDIWAWRDNMEGYEDDV